jgi:hypothetical protein
MTLLLAGVACYLGAQTTPANKAAEEEAEWVKIREIKALYEEAVGANQIDKLRPFIASNFHGVLVNGREARSFDELVKRNQELRDLIGAGGTYKVKVNYEPGHLFGNYATAFGTAEETVVTGSGKTFAFTSTWLANLAKEDGQWKLHRLQASLDPVENVFVKDTVKYTSILFGGGGVILGAVLGFLVRSFRK